MIRLIFELSYFTVLQLAQLGRILNFLSAAQRFLMDVFAFNEGLLRLDFAVALGTYISAMLCGIFYHQHSRMLT